MTPQEFKAWFEGFTEAMSGSPTKEQWKRIKARVGEIDDVAVSYPMFVDRYVRHYPHYVWSTFTITSTSGSNPPNIVTMNTRDDGHSVFNSSAAMCDLGKADYQALAG